MTSHEILKADALDILFEGRNKLYGAYYLRKHYNNNLAISLAIAVSSVFLLVLLIPNGENSFAVSNEKPDVIVQTVVIPPTVIPPPVIPLPPRVTPPPRLATAALTPQFLIVNNPDPEKEMQAVEVMLHTAISNINSTGLLVPNVQTVPPANTTAITTNGAEKLKEFVPVEKQPEFPGGMQAWTAFLNRHLQTPEELAAGERRTVMISFFVDAQGLVTGFKIAQSGGVAFDNEVIRVLKKMPKWNPAIQNGNAIATSFKQPVTFVGAE